MRDKVIKSEPAPFQLSEPRNFTVSIEPKGQIELTLNQLKVFTANVSTQDIPFNYTWSIENSFSKRIAFNETNYLLLTCGNQAVFKFLSQQSDFFWLTVSVNSTDLSDKATVAVQYVNPQTTESTEKQGNGQQTSQQTQTSNQNNYYTTINSLASTASYIVKPDGFGMFQVINGTNGNTVEDYASASADITLNKAIAQGGIIVIKVGNYTGANLNVPTNANIIAEPEVVGIKYASISDGAKIDEPTFNTAFGRYSSGSLTITTNLTKDATSTTWYLAFKPDNSIYYVSTNASEVLNVATNLAGAICIRNALMLNNPVMLSKSKTSIYSDGNGRLSFNCTDGLIIKATEVSLHDITIEQVGRERTKRGIAFEGTFLKPSGYETLNNIKIWGWDTALVFNYTSSSHVTAVDTSFSHQALYIWGQSVNNVFSQCEFANYGSTKATVLIERDDCLDLSPEGNIISSSLIYGGKWGVYLKYSIATAITDSIIDGWAEKGVVIIGRENNIVSNNWIARSNGVLKNNAIEINADSTIIKGNTLSADNYTIYVYSSLNCIIAENQLISCAFCDIYIADSQAGSVSQNNLAGSSQNGIILNDCNHFSLNGNTLNNKTIAINVINSRHNSISSNIINCTLRNAIILDYAQYNSINGNSIYDIGEKPYFAYAYIWIVDGSMFNSIDANIISILGVRKTAWGILEGSLADDFNIYSGNIITGNISGGIGIKGANSVRSENIPSVG
jgi:hypothetical protein